MAFRADLSRVAWLLAGSGVESRLEVYDPEAPGTALPDPLTDAKAYTLYRDGVSIATATWTRYDDNTLLATATPSSALAVGDRLVERWELRGDDIGIDVDGIGGFLQRDVYVTTWSMAPPITTTQLLPRHPTMNDYPTGQTSWDPQIARAWTSIERDLIQQTPAARSVLANPVMLAELCELKAWAYIFRQAATFTGGSYIQMAEHYEALAAMEWERLTMEFDTDGDYDFDTKPTPPAARNDFPGRNRTQR